MLKKHPVFPLLTGYNRLPSPATMGDGRRLCAFFSAEAIKMNDSRYEGVEKIICYGTERLPQRPRFHEKRAETECISGH